MSGLVRMRLWSSLTLGVHELRGLVLVVLVLLLCCGIRGWVVGSVDVRLIGVRCMGIGVLWMGIRRIGGRWTGRWV